jgi:type I restriction enzyme, S subunit
VSYSIQRLKDCCEVVGGATPKRNVPSYWGRDIPWVTPKDISGLRGPILEDAPEYISHEGYKSCSTRLLPLGSVLLTSRAPIGNVAITGRELCTNQGFKSLIPGKGVNSNYLYHCLKTFAPRLQSLGNGATFKEVNTKTVGNFEIPLPPLEEQKRIAAILDKADAIRKKRKQAIELADQFLKSVFLDMFGDISAKKSAYPFTGCRGAVSAASGKSSKQVLASNVTQIPVYGGNGINGYATESLYDEQVIVVGRVGQQCGITNLTTGPCWVTDNAIVIKVTDNKKYNPVYLAHAFMHSPIRDTVTRLDLPFVNQPMLLDHPIPAPPIAEQDKFESIYKQVRVTRSRLVEELSVSDSLFGSLSQKAFKHAADDDQAA